MARINWREEFDRVDEENMKLLCESRKEQLRKIIMQLAFGMEDEQGLCNVATFMASYNDKRINRVMGGYEVKAKEGVA